MIHDPADAVGLFEDVQRGIADLVGVGFKLQVLGQAGDARNRVADLVGDPAARRPMEASRSLCSNSFPAVRSW